MAVGLRFCGNQPENRSAIPPRALVAASKSPHFFGEREDTVKPELQQAHTLAASPRPSRIILSELLGA
jgi:hypothetical protein